MRITYKGDYALKTILDLAIHYGSAPVTIPDLAKRADIPVKFLEQILLELKKGGFVESRRGNIGGYLLARNPSEITVGDIVRFIEGPIEPISCVKKGYKGCSDLHNCAFREIWSEISLLISGVVDRVTFAELVAKLRAKKEAFNYQI